MSQSTAIYICDRCKARVYSKGWSKHRGKALCAQAMLIQRHKGQKIFIPESVKLNEQMRAAFLRFGVPYTCKAAATLGMAMILAEPWVGILIACIASAATIGATPYTVLKVGATDLAVRAM